MAVYTPISRECLARSLLQFDLTLQGYPEAVSDGIENTTYFFDAACPKQGLLSFVLTIFEGTATDQILFAVDLTRLLASDGLPVPAPLVSSEGLGLLDIAGKQALVFPRAPGIHNLEPGERECAVIGDFLARFHLSSQKLEKRFQNSRGLSWLSQSIAALNPLVDPETHHLLAYHLENSRALALETNLPSGAIHGDLFRDNALFFDGKLSAVIDFYNACTDCFLLDVAITLNDWCIDKSSRTIHPGLALALLDSYHKIRPFNEKERKLWQPMVEMASLRFWVSRLLGQHGLLGAKMKTKDPEEYRKKLNLAARDLPPLPQ